MVLEIPEFSFEGPYDLICRQGLGFYVNQVMQACSLQMEGQDLTVYEGSGNKCGQVNRIGSSSADLTGKFGHLVTKFFNILSGFVRKPLFLKGLDKYVNGGGVDLLLLLDNVTE